MSIKEVDTNNLLEALVYNHIAMSVGSKESVDEITAKLKKDGYAILKKPCIAGDGYYESLFLGFDNLLIKLTI